MSVISFHSISPILEAFELSVIPFESIISPAFLSNNFLNEKSPVAPDLGAVFQI